MASRPEGRGHAGRQAAGRGIEVFEHPRAAPVGVGAVLEDDVHERHAEEREAAHHLRPRHRQHGGGQRIGDLILHDLRRLAGVLGVDDGLHVREVGDGVERQRPQRHDARRHGEHRADQNQDEVPGGPADETRDHGLPSRFEA